MAHTTLDAVDILDVAGFDTIIIETVGVGQDEVEIVKASHTTVVVTPPGLGDEVQAIKAGVLEIADIHVVSKCDRSDANRAITDLKHMLMLGMGAKRQRPCCCSASPPISKPATARWPPNSCVAIATRIRSRRNFSPAP
jgi:LAO/AO transport system kinase